MGAFKRSISRNPERCCELFLLHKQYYEGCLSSGVLSWAMSGSSAKDWQATTVSEVKAVSIPAEIVAPMLWLESDGLCFGSGF